VAEHVLAQAAPVLQPALLRIENNFLFLRFKIPVFRREQFLFLRFEIPVLRLENNFLFFRFIIPVLGTENDFLFL
jgi:hypothetical protein